MAKTVFREDSDRVGFAELFFDLVFVFAITQVSHSLLQHYDLAGALQTGFLFLAIWWVWMFSTWSMNSLDPEQTAVRGLLFILMGLGLFLSMALPDAFGDRGLVFAGAYAAMQVGRSVFIWANSADQNSGDQLRRTYTRITIWMVLAAVFWILGGLAEGQDRVMLWCVALGLEYVAPMTGMYVQGLGRDESADWSVRGGHMAERCGLFVIICLGETLLVSGATFAEMEWTAPGLLAFLGAFASAIGMWWVYFHIGHKRATHQIEHSQNAASLARLAFTYLHIPIVAGVVLGAVGSERAIAHPLHMGTYAEGASLIGGLVLFLLGNGLFKRVSANNFPLSHWVGLGLALAAFVTGPFMPLFALNGVSALILVVVAAWESWSWNRKPKIAT
jgi:low temperature requirement protein LtrA